MQPATCEFQELVPEPVSSRPAAVPAPAVGHVPGTPGQVLALQRSAGNTAVAKLLRLVTSTPVAVTPHTAAELRAMTLGDFAAFARRQADWHAAPDLRLPANLATRDALRGLLEWSESGADHPVLTACQDMVVDGLLTHAMVVPGRANMQAYAEAVVDDTFAIDSAGASVETALRWGFALRRLAALDPGVLRRVIRQNGQFDYLEQLTHVMGDLVGDFVTYAITAPAPLLDSEYEVDSYVWLRRGHIDPQPLKGVIQHVRNFHRFHATSLKKLRTAWATGNPGNLPFTLVLYPALDHNAAFHRDEQIREVIANANNFTLVIEGATSLAQVGTEAHDLVGRFGRPDGGGVRRLQQVMIAGHGGPRGMELAGDAVPGHEGDEDTSTRNRSDDLDLDRNPVATARLLDGLLDEMDPADPRSRILLNACLTSAADFRPADGIPSSRRRAAQRIGAIVTARPNFADSLRDRAALRGFDRGSLVSAASASFTGEAHLIDPATGELELTSPATYDPELANPDRMAYIRDGSEPEGYMRAVVELYARRREVVAAIRTKLASAERGQWPDRVTRAFARVALFRIHEPHVLAQMIEATWPLGELNVDADCHVEAIAGIPGRIVGDVFPRLLAAPPNAEWASQANIRLVVLQRWAGHASGHDGPLLAELAALDVQALAPWVDAAYLESRGVLRRIVAGGFAGTAGEGRLRLALLEVVEGGGALSAVTALRRFRGRSAVFADRARVADALGGAGSPEDVLDAIREPAPGGGAPHGASAPPPENANVDTDGDGMNDLYVTHMTRRGANAAAEVDLRRRPAAAAPVTGRIARGTVVPVIGRTDDGFLAVEEAGTTQFVREADLPLL